MSQFKFYLDSSYNVPNGSRQEIVEPVGWDTRKPTLTRNETYHGLFRSFTVNLEFVKNGYDYLSWVDENIGILAEVFIEIYEYSNKDHEYILQDKGKLDFTTYKESDKSGKGATVDVADTSFNEKIKSREDILINYNSSKDLDNKDMSAPVYVDTTILGMDVIALANCSSDDLSLVYYTESQRTYFPPITADGQIDGLKNVFGGISDYIAQGEGSRFRDVAFLETQETGTLTFNSNFKFGFRVSNPGPTFTFFLALRQIRINDSNDTYQIIKTSSYVSPVGNNITYTGQTLDIVDEVYDVIEGDVFVLEAQMTGNSTVSEENGFFQLEEAFNINILSKDKAAPTVSKSAFIFDVFRRTIESTTGKADALTSTIFGAGGLYEKYTLQNGLLIRNYTPEESQMSVKFRDFFQDIEKIFNVGLGVENDIVDIRAKQDYFQNGVVLTIDKGDIEADSFEISTDTEYFYSDVEIGYAKSAYEEISGLEEYNNKSNFNTILSNLNQKLEAVSKTRGDVFGMEFARRLQKASDETEDSKYDLDNFILNVIEDGENYKQRTTEGFTDVTGIEFIDTPGNLEITPAQNLFRWGWMLSAGLKKYADSVIKFNSSDAFTDLSTTKDGKTVQENADIPVSELDNPLFTGKKITFSAPLSLSNYNMLKTGDNKYKLIKVWDPVKELYRFGWIREAGVEAVDKSTNWELIEAKDAIEVLSYWLTNDGFKWLWNSGDGILLNEQE